MKFSLSRCKLVAITIEKSTVNNELNKKINKKYTEDVIIIHNIFNTSSSFHAAHSGKDSISVLLEIFASATKFSFREED